MATQRYYSSIAVDNSLASAINSTATTISLVNSPIGFPGTFPFTLAIDYDSPLEELVIVTGMIGTTLTVSRADAGNGTGTCGTAVAHNAGAVVRHVVTGQDMTDITNFVYTPVQQASSVPDLLMLFGG